MELLFHLEEGLPDPSTLPEPFTQDGLLLAHLRFLTKPQTPFSARLKRDMDLWAGRRPCPTVEDLCHLLLSLGYPARVVTVQGGGKSTAAFRKLGHEFVLVSDHGVGGGAGGDDAAAPLVVDPRFREQFHVANPSPRFAAMLDLLPKTFVGGIDQLAHVVEWLCREMYWSFKQQGQPLPPWREHAAMMSKWQVQQPQAPPLDSPGSMAASPAACQMDIGSRAAEKLCAASGFPAHMDRAPSPVSVLLQQAAMLACSGPPTPMHNQLGSGTTTRPTSLLSRSLEAAGLRKPAACSAFGATGLSCQQPRIHVVRRSAP